MPGYLMPSPTKQGYVFVSKARTLALLAGTISVGFLCMNEFFSTGYGSSP